MSNNDGGWDDPDRAYEEYRDRILDGHLTGCSILKCLCGKGTPFDPPKEVETSRASTGWDGTIRVKIENR